MMLTVLGFLGINTGDAIKYAVIGLGISILVGTAYYYVSGYYRAWSEVQRLETVAQLLKNEINTQIELRELESNARAKADEALSILRDQISTIRKDRDIIYNAPDEEDGPVAPVLRNYIDRLRNDAGNDNTDTDIENRDTKPTP